MKATPIVLAAIAALAACGSESEEPVAANGTTNEAATTQRQAGNDLAEGLSQSADHSSFMQAIETAGLSQTLRGVGPYTLFAPTNAAFAAIPAETRDGLNSPDQRERLITLLSYHIVPGTVTVQDLRRAIESGPGGRAELATVAGDNLTLTSDGEAILVGDGSGARGRIVQADQLHSNGVVHSVDVVLMPGNE